MRHTVILDKSLYITMKLTLDVNQCQGHSQEQDQIEEDNKKREIRGQSQCIVKRSRMFCPLMSMCSYL